MKAKNQDVKYILVEGAKHGDLPWYQPNIINTVVNFFKEKLGDPAKIAESKQVKGGNLQFLVQANRSGAPGASGNIFGIKELRI